MQCCCQIHNRLYGQLRLSVEIPCQPMVQEGVLEKYTKFHDPKMRISSVMLCNSLKGFLLCDQSDQGS